MAEERLGTAKRSLTKIVIVIAIFCVVLTALVLWIEIDKNKGNEFCRDLANPSALDRFWIFDCAPNWSTALLRAIIIFLVAFLPLGGPALITRLILAAKRR